LVWFGLVWSEIGLDWGGGGPWITGWLVDWLENFFEKPEMVTPVHVSRKKDSILILYCPLKYRRDYNISRMKGS
jgi:hypothetical protein